MEMDTVIQDPCERLKACSLLKTKVHNARQTLTSLRKRRKQLRGRVGATRAELRQSEGMLARCEEQLECAKTLLLGLELAQKTWPGPMEPVGIPDR